MASDPRRNDPEWLSIPTIAKKCTCTEATVKRWIKEGHLRSVKLSTNFIRVPREDYERFIEDRKVESFYYVQAVI